MVSELRQPLRRKRLNHAPDGFSTACAASQDSPPYHLMERGPPRGQEMVTCTASQPQSACEEVTDRSLAGGCEPHHKELANLGRHHSPQA